MEDDKKPFDDEPNKSEEFRPHNPQQRRISEHERLLREEQRIREEERRLREDENRLARARRESVVNRAVNIVYYIVGALLILLALRFILRLFGANQENLFARVIYDFSAPFVAPFSTLFISPTLRGGESIFDVNLIIAMLVYTLLAWLVGRFIQLIWAP
ncbi:MAG: YggT family protein [Elainellaceae cyanobacterium]